ncbi:hypothetical protein ABK040_000255 [Willaertia magna]
MLSAKEPEQKKIKLASSESRRLKNNNEIKPVIPFIYKTRDIIVIDKPYDLHIDGEYDVTVEKLVNEQYPEMINPKEEIQHKKGQEIKRKLKFCHQLDYATSGILCLAFTRKSCASISTNFQERKAKKYYLAIVQGHLPEELNTFHIKTWINEDVFDENKFKMRNYYIEDKETKEKKCLIDLDLLKTNEERQFCEQSKESETEGEILSRGYYKVKDDNNNNSNNCEEKIPVTKVLLKPKTGRRHQLRLHCLQLGYPIFGDFNYMTDKEMIHKAHRMMLHAYKLQLKDFPELKTNDPFSKEDEFEWNL